MVREEARGLGGDVRDDGAERRELVERDAQSGKSSGRGVLLGTGGQPLAQEDGEDRVGGELRHAGVAQPAAVSVAETADLLAQQGAEVRVGGDGFEVAPPGLVVGEPGAQREAVRPRAAGAGGLVVRFGHGDAGGEAEVEEVEVGRAPPAALEQVDGAPVGAQPVGHPGDEVQGARTAAGRRPVASPVRLPAGEPVRRGDGRVGGGGRRVAERGQHVLGAGRGQQAEPAGFAVRVLAVLAEGLREEAEEPGPHGLVGTGEGGERGAVRRPERGGGADDSGRADEVRHQLAFGALAVQAGGLDQRADVLRQRGVGRHARGAALHEQPAELRPGVLGGEPRHQVAYVLPQRLHGQRAGEGELQEDGPLPVLVHDQAVDPLGFTGLAEEGGGVGGVLGLEEEARHLLVVGGEEVRHGTAEPGAQFVEALLGRAGAGLGLPAEPFDVLDQGQCVVAVGRVVDQGPGGEAECLAADLSHDGGFLGPGQPQELQGEVLGLAERAGDEADQRTVPEGGVRVGAGGQRVGVVPVGRAGREDRARVQQGGRTGPGGTVGGTAAAALGGKGRRVRRRRVRAGLRSGVRRGAHAARSSSSTSRPA